MFPGTETVGSYSGGGLQFAPSTDGGFINQWASGNVQLGDTSGQTGATGGAYYDPYAAQQAAQRQAEINYVNQVFDTQKAGLQSQFDTLGAQQGAAERNLTNNYNTSLGGLNTSRTRGLRNLSDAENSVNEQRARSLQEIRDNLLKQSMSYNNQLGTFGAGDSSAAGMINFALAGAAGKNRGNVMNNASDQTRAITTRRGDLEEDYNTNLNTLNNWKANSLQQLALEYTDKKNQIQSAMAQADAQRAQQLAQYDAAYTQQAIQALQNLQNTYAQQASQLNSMYGNMNKSVALNPTNTSYQVNPIQAGRMAGIGNVQSQTYDPVAVMKRYEEDQQRSILGY